MSYWIVRNMESDAVAILDEDPKPEIIEMANGIHLGRIVLMGERFHFYKIRRFTTPAKGPTSEDVLVSVATKISKTEYETFQEFGLFDE